MLAQQLRCADVLDTRILETLQAVPRERFVPAQWRNLAFADTGVPLPHGQSMLTPTLDGQILQALSLSPQDRALEIGTGSGFLSACLARLCDQVTSLEVFPELVEAAQARLDQLRISNCELRVADAFAAEPGEFDVIAVTGSMPLWDARFEQWLRPGGRLFLVVGNGQYMQAWRVVRQAENQWQRQRLFETSIPPLLHARPAPRFTF